MAYCRFGDGGVYMYHHVDGFIECCACRLAPLINTIFTKGLKKGDIREKFFGHIPSCDRCNGKGCGHCRMHGNKKYKTRRGALKHLQAHRDAGHTVPQYAFDQLKEEIEEEGNNPSKYEYPEEHPQNNIPTIDIEA